MVLIETNIDALSKPEHPAISTRCFALPIKFKKIGVAKRRERCYITIRTGKALFVEGNFSPAHLPFKEALMAWNTPVATEVCVGMEVTSYASAEI